VIIEIGEADGSAVGRKARGKRPRRVQVGPSAQAEVGGLGRRTRSNLSKPSQECSETDADVSWTDFCAVF
jgi:hypothetical protein